MPKKLKKKLDLRKLRKHFRVAIYGSARLKKNDPRYKMIYALAKKIAEEGIDLVSGGGPGLMDASSRGHHAGRKKKNNHALAFGLTIRLPTEQRESYHLDIKREFNKFSNRLDHFIALSNVVVVAPGGIGTMLELMYTWQLVQVKQVCDIPIILLGDMWSGLLEWIRKSPIRSKFMDKSDMNLVFHAKTVSQAMTIIKAANTEFKKNKKDVCLNLRKYRVHGR